MCDHTRTASARWLVMDVRLTSLPGRHDIEIEGERIVRIGAHAGSPADAGRDGRFEFILEGRGMYAVPSMINCHTHAAMTLFRGHADDMPLMPWLREKIWPHEAKITQEDVYHGTRLACLEMIRTGTTFYSDMYWHFHGSARAAYEMGIRAAVSAVFIDNGSESAFRQQRDLNRRLYDECGERYAGRVRFQLGPHAVYTVSERALAWMAGFAEEHRLNIHIHVSETKGEVEECLRLRGTTPLLYLHRLGLVNRRSLLIHCVWLTDQEIELVAASGATVVHNPVSNMKLAVGRHLPYTELKRHGARIALGTDGCASNNGLNMFESMKLAALLQKFCQNDPTCLPADEAFDLATRCGAEAFQLECGTLAAGMEADFLLVDPDGVTMTPDHHVVSNLVYATLGSAIDTTVCRGHILMRGGRIDGEREVIEQAGRQAKAFVSR